MDTPDNVSFIIESALATYDSTTVLKQFIQKLSSSHKRKYKELLQLVEKVDYLNTILSTKRNYKFFIDYSYSTQWFTSVNAILDKLADLVTSAIKSSNDSFDNSENKQIGEYQQQLNQLIQDYKDHAENESESKKQESSLADQDSDEQSERRDRDLLDPVPNDFLQTNQSLDIEKWKTTKRESETVMPATDLPETTSRPAPVTNKSTSCCSCLPSFRKRAQVTSASPNNSLQSSSKPRLMISYNWDSQAICKQIYDRLKDDGHTVWFDVKNMHGCIYSAMAEAVEKAQIILFGMTEKYRHSDNCRKELTYACKRRKRLIPLRLQSKYDPDGWLGLISAELLYIDFTKNDFDTNYQSLLKEIQSSDSDL